MFHGTQYVPQQIAEAFLARGCVDSCASVKEVLSKLTDDTKLKYQDGLTPLGSEKPVTLSAHWTIALERLLDVTVNKQVGVTHQRFILQPPVIFKSELHQIQTAYKSQCVS